MRNSPRRGIDVFNYDEDDDDVTDSLAGKHSGKLRSPSPKDHALSARDFVECVFPGTAVQKSEIANVPCVHVDAVDCNPSCDKATLRSALDKAENKIVSMNECNEERPSSHEEHLELRLLDKAENKIVSMNECDEERPSSHEEHLELRLDNEGSRNFVSEAEKTLVELKASPPTKFELNCDRLDSSSESEHIDVTSGVDESVTRSSSSSPASGMAEDDDLSNDCALDHCSGDMEMDDMNMTVVLYPDYITYRDNYYTGPRVIFSDSCIKIMGSTAYGNQEAFDFEWGCDDVVNIVSQMFQKVETVMIKLRVLSKDENVHQHTGIDEVNIFVVEPNWCEKLEEITSLNQRYFTVWDHADDSDMGTGIDGDDSPRVRRYFPVFEESFEDVIYPKGEADAVSISKRDVDLLQPETFVNDTIIDFYIKYLKNQIQPEERHKFHFFNSFFFRKLADLDKDPSSASDGAAAFQRVRKWTRKVDLFGKEFVVVPINFSLHWSLIVICHPGEAAAFTDENLDKSLKVPCILHMDSIKGNHAGLKHLIQSYLFEEWKEREKETSEEVSSRFHNLRFVSLELPQQENSFDCGLFLLHYLERFLAEVPDNFNPFKIEKPSTFLYSNWFPPTEASLKRALIQRLISELLKNHSKGVSTSASSDDDQIMESNVNGVGGNFLSARFDPGPSCKQTTLPSSEVGRGIELTLLSASSIKSSQCINDSDLVLRDLFNPGASLMGQRQSFDQKPSDYGLNGDISPSEEAPETGEQILFGENEFDRPQLTGNTQSGSIPYPSKEYGGETFGVGISLQAEHRGINCSREPSIGISDDEPDIAITEAFSVAEYSSPSQKERTEEPRSSSVEHVEFIKGLVSASHDLPDTSAAAEAFQNCEMVQSGNENESGVPSFFENQDVLVSQDAVMSDDDVHMIEDDGMVASKTSGQKPLDNSIGSGDNVQNVEDGLVSLDAPEPLPIGSGGNIDEVGLVGLASLGLELVDNGTGSGDNAQFQAPGQQPVHNGTGSNDNTRMVADDPVLLDSPIQQSVGITTGLEIVTASVDNIEIVVEDGLAGLGSSEQKPVDDVTASVDNSQIFEDASVGLDSPEQQPVDDATGSGDDSHIYEDAMMGPDSPGQKRVENVVGLGDNSLVFEDASAYSGSPHNVQVAECSLLAPNSLCQQSADNGSGSSNDVLTKDDEFVTPENGIGSGDDFQMKEDEFVAPENGTGSGDDMQMKDNEFVAPENRTGSDDNALMNEDGSHEHQHEKIGLGDNMQIVEDIDLAVRDSSQLQPGQIVIDSGYVPIVKHNSVAPDSPRQHPAKRPRLLPSVEDETGAVKSLTEN